MMFSMLNIVVMDYHKEIQSEVTDSNVVQLSERELVVLKYVASACIHSVGTKIKPAVENRLIGRIHEARIYHKAQKFLDSLHEPEVKITKYSSEPETLVEIIRRQVNKKALTFISYNVFEFFKNMYSLIKSVQNFDQIERNPGNILQDTVLFVEQNQMVVSSFCELFTTFSNTCSCSMEESNLEYKDMKNILQYKLDEALVLHIQYKVVLYMPKVHLNDITLKYLDTVVHKKKLFKLDIPFQTPQVQVNPWKKLIICVVFVTKNALKSLRCKVQHTMIFQCNVINVTNGTTMCA